MFTSSASFGRTAAVVAIVAGAACLLSAFASPEDMSETSRAFVVVDVDGDGLKTCPLVPTSRLARGEVVVQVARWICPGDDDAVVLVQNPGRPISTADVLGLKVGPENGIEFLAKFGRNADQVLPRVLLPSEPLFQTIVLWNDVNADVTIHMDEVSGFAFLGFDKLELNHGGGGRSIDKDPQWLAHAMRGQRTHLVAAVPFEGQ